QTIGRRAQRTAEVRPLYQTRFALSTRPTRFFWVLRKRIGAGSQKRLLAPQLIDADVAPAPYAIGLVVNGVGDVEVLVVILGRVKRRRILDFGDDGQPSFLGQCGLARLGCLTLLLIKRKDRRTVAFAPIAELPARIGRVRGVPENRQQLRKAHYVGIVFDLDHFIMAGILIDDLLVAWVLHMPAGKARRRGGNPFDLVEIGFNAPEAPAGEKRRICE